MVFVAVFAALAVSFATNEFVEDRPSSTKNVFESEAIIGGNTIHIDSARFMVQVVAEDTKQNKMSSCGGTLVSPSQVLTAGHCVNAKPDQLTVFAGASEYMEIGRSGNTYEVKKFLRHPKYTVKTVAGNVYAVFDVAVLLLKTKVQLGPKTAVIKITAPNHLPRVGSSLFVSGWGIYKANVTKASRKLRTASYPLLSSNACKTLIGMASAIQQQEFCIGSKKLSSFCNGDSGGPAYIGGVQYGVISWGSCGDKNVPSVLANLADPQINAFVRNAMKILK